jgi:uncharacterized protein involved in exopolysaccharide biosynthesis
MSDQQGQQRPGYDDEIDLFELVQTVWSGKWVIILVSILAAAVSAWVSLQLPNVYTVQVKIAPVEDEGGAQMNALVGQYGGLASLAGIPLPSGGSGQSELLLEILQSRSFLEPFIRDQSLGPRLIAIEGYDLIEKQEVVDSEKYDPTEKRWVRVVELPQTPEPSGEELFEAFSEALSVTKDKTSPVITISFEHRSPLLGYEVLAALVKRVDDFARSRDRTRSQQSIEYLEQKLSETRLVDVEKVLYQMIESQTKTLMLAEVNKDYAFQVIDAPQVPEKHSKPSRALIVVLSTLVGGMLATLWVLVRSAVRNRRNAGA